MTDPEPISIDQSGFRRRLQAELAARCRRNPGYSIRAFAKYLGVHHASLSLLIRGHRRFTRQSITRLAVRLGLSVEELDRYLTPDGGLSVDGYPDSRLATSLVEIIELDRFQPDSRWIARMLGVEVDRVNVILTELLRTGRLTMTTRRHWVHSVVGLTRE